ncbi:hypothetical protein J437_LFUL000311 [Ladona fulva]|uniref:Uncharacterized protein n=1 Tax=Ladona fulva TaxID=123851 RepID=A0A8K0K2A8_LADFU|nr:hypothetical protein J437_LFUL000311 [Ladona fulva]
MTKEMKDPAKGDNLEGKYHALDVNKITEQAVMTSKEELESVPKLINTATYPLWEFEIRILFETKQLMSVIDGTNTLEKCGADEKKKREWITKDANTKLIILRTIVPQ